MAPAGPRARRGHQPRPNCLTRPPTREPPPRHITTQQQTRTPQQNLRTFSTRPHEKRLERSRLVARRVAGVLACCAGLLVLRLAGGCRMSGRPCRMHSRPGIAAARPAAAAQRPPAALFPLAPSPNPTPAADPLSCLLAAPACSAPLRRPGYIPGPSTSPAACAAQLLPALPASVPARPRASVSARANHLPTSLHCGGGCCVPSRCAYTCRSCAQPLQPCHGGRPCTTQRPSRAVRGSRRPSRPKPLGCCGLPSLLTTAVPCALRPCTTCFSPRPPNRLQHARTASKPLPQ